MKKIKLLLLLAAVILALLLWKAFNARHTPKPALDREEQTEEQAVQVIAEKARYMKVQESIAAVGNVEPLKQVVIYPEATGILEALKVKEGDFVEKGAFIASIENEQRRLNVQQVEIEIKASRYQMENIRQDYNRYKRLAEEGAVAAKRFEDIETLFNSTREKIKGLEKQLEIAQRRLKDTVIFAPISGIVAQRFIDEGELVTESTMTKSSPLVAIADISQVKITVPVGEAEIKNIRKGQKASVETDSREGSKFYGTVNRIQPVADFATRTTTVEILIDNPGHKLKPGMFARAVIETGSKNILAVSLDALLRMPSSGNYYCFAIEKGRAKKAYIEIGGVWDGKAEVVSGLKEGDAVIVTSHGILETGTPVTASFGENG